MYWIYIIINKINDKKYVGYTSKKPPKRFKEHIYFSKGNNQRLLSKAIRKYGVDCFHLVWISHAPDIELAKCFEKRTIKIFNSYGIGGYNMTEGGDGSGPHTNKHKEYMKNIMTNRIISNETKKKMSDSAKNKPKSEEFKKKVSLKLKNDPTIKNRNKIAGIMSHYKRGHKLSEESLNLIRSIL